MAFDKRIKNLFDWWPLLLICNSMLKPQPIAAWQTTCSRRQPGNQESGGQVLHNREAFKGFLECHIIVSLPLPN